MNIATAFRSNRLMKSLTGMTINEVNSLSIVFNDVFETNKQINYKKIKRQRQLGGGRKHKLDTTLKKLFFILFYIKCYPTFDLAGFYFDVNRSQTLRWTQMLLPILEKTLNRNITLPKRQIHTKEEFEQLFPEIKDLFIDGVERPINKPKNKKQNRKNYSGKKKRHVKKNIIASNDKKEVLFLSPTDNGRIHDKKLLDKNMLICAIPDKIAIWADTGFTGIQKQRDNIMMPKKKPKGKSLNLEDKQENMVISSIRIKVEHAINGVKRFKAVADIFRNHIPKLEDKLILVACGLWNYHLRMS